jgi:hypothetical protein
MANRKHFESGRKAWETRRRRMAADLARPRLAMIRRISDQQYYSGGWGFETFWTPLAIQAAHLTVELAERAQRNLAIRGIHSEVINL